MKDWSPIEHAVYATLTQTIVALLTHDWWTGAAAGAWFFIGRELAQAEYRWVEQYGGHKRANLPWYGSLDWRVWTLDSMLDWIVPCLAVVAVALYFR